MPSLKHLLLAAGALALVILTAGVLLRDPAGSVIPSAPTRTSGPTASPGLPARATATPLTRTATPFALPTALITPRVTPPFSFPTREPFLTPAPAADCTALFPIESVEAIRLGTTTTAQLRAAFGAPDSTGGRPPTYRFVRDGCTLAVAIGVAEAQEVELAPYATLDWLLDRYGPPAAVGISQGNLVLLLPGQAVLLYPDRGLIAIFDALPADLTRSTPIAALQFRTAYTIDQQVRRLKLAPVAEWLLPLR